MFQTNISTEKKSGFALIIALSLMAFTLLLLLSISTLVKVEQSASQFARSQMQTRENALLSLQLALGNLQMNLGPDQRVSATADTLTATNPGKKNVTGARATTDNTQIEGQNHNKDDIIKWLISDAQDEIYHQTAPTGPARAPEAVLLLGAGSLLDANNDQIADTPEHRITATRSPIYGNSANSETGHYTWWIGDEDVKASINLTDPTTAETGKSAKQQALLTRNSQARSDLQLLDGLANLNLQEDGLAGRLTSIQQLALTDPAIEDALKSNFHDLTLWSHAVLADARSGGLKKDLSLAFELTDNEFDNSVFGSNGADPITTQTTNGLQQIQPIFRLDNSTGVSANGPPWHLLRDYYSIYKQNENVMQGPTFTAQAFTPNRAELAGTISGTHSYQDLAACRFIASETISKQAQGDPLRTAQSGHQGQVCFSGIPEHIKPL
jgi:hypothetical protein